jgi:hypothetical protein
MNREASGLNFLKMKDKWYKSDIWRRCHSRFRACEKSTSGAGILPASDAAGGGNAWFPASPEHGRDARATRFS